MAFLNWRQQAGLGQELTDAGGAEGGARFVLTLAPSERDALVLALDELFAEGAAPAELRVDLPRGWILFWKPRAGESRLLLSHPSKDEYVATAALLAEHGRAFAARLGALGGGQALTVSEASDVALGAFSNVEVELRLAGGDRA